ncbi:MAG TPA: glutamate synthase central domain-containing protein, partial [Streptosporangiaceae bacterium]
LMMIPEPWENHEEMTPERRAFYRYHAALMEPWDGPALIAFTDGSVIGAVLDRNGLRPGRYWVTSDGLVVLASEVGVLDIDPDTVIRKGRLQPGRVFLADTAAGRLVEDEEVKAALAAEHPYENWLHAGLVYLDDLPDPRGARGVWGDGQSPQSGGPRGVVPREKTLLAQQRVHGYTEEELRVILAPMARAGAEPIGSMGTDTPVAVLSGRPRLMFDYFAQLFAQVTNPPLDAIREELVTSLGTITGPEQNLLHPIPASCRQIVLPYPVIDDNDLAKIVHINDEGNLPGFASHVVDGRYDPAGGGAGLRARLADICAEVSAAIRAGARLIILSDRARGGSQELVPIPSLLLTGTVHHHLIKQKSRTRAGLVVEAGDVRECHHVALLVGYGAAAVNPYLAIESVRDLVRRGVIENVSEKKAEANLLKALGKGLLKIMSKMGVSTVASYTGAQIFEAIGLGPEVIEACFTGTTSRLSGVGFDQLASEISQRTGHATGAGAGMDFRRLDTGGEYQWRREGEPHLFSPEVVFKLQHATRSRRYEIFKEYTSLVDDQSRRLMTLRGLLRIKGVDAEDGQETPPVRVEDVESVASIVRRFATGAMSYGSISAEAHQTLAIAMNRLGGRSNTGEGGEDADRFIPDANGDLRRSAVKQVASGRFGVTSEYLVNADDLQIKM